MSANDSVSRATLANLPKEIKFIILKAVQLQDRAFRARRQNEKDGGALRMMMTSAKLWHGRGIKALFLVNQEWHDLASSILFEEVSSIRMAGPLFKYRINAKYGHYIRGLSFIEGSTQEFEEGILVGLNSLPNLQRLKISLRSYYAMFPYRDIRIWGDRGFPNAGPLNETVRMVEEAFGRLAKNILDLTLQVGPYPEVSNFLPLFPNLRRLFLISTQNNSLILDTYISELHHLPQLHHLSLVSHEFIIDISPGCNTTPMPALRSLHLQCQHPHPPLADFIGSVSSSLDTLSLTLSRQSDARFELSRPIRFPHLKAFIFDGSEATLSQLLADLRRAPLRLIDCDLLAKPDTPLLSSDQIRPFLPTLSSLRLNYFNRQFSADRRAAILNELWNTPGRHAAAESSLSSANGMKVRNLQSKAGLWTVEDVLQFAKREKDRCWAVGDEVAWQALMKALEPLAGLHLLAQG